MRLAFQYLRSVIFIVQMYIVMPIMAVIFLIPMLISPKGAHLACMTYARWVIWTAGWMVGMKTEIRGTPPTHEVMVAAKHQSFFDIMLIFAQLPYAKFIMKKELLYAPILGQFAYRLGAVPVDRGGRAKAINKMVADVKAGRSLPGQLVIYPQGTRVDPGVQVPYKVGTYVLYKQLQQECVPVAVNVGVFWPKRGILRKPGTVVVEFLPAIPVGKSQEEFMEALETAVEDNSNRLMEEAGFKL